MQKLPNPKLRGNAGLCAQLCSDPEAKGRLASACVAPALTSCAFEVETSVMPAIWMLPLASSLSSRGPEAGFSRSRITSL